jgi:hypothetical protein
LSNLPKLLTALFLACFASACAADHADPSLNEPSVDDGQDLASEAYVDSPTWQRARRHMNWVVKQDYIPFSYIKDGCQSRALYMSMELAAARIPSSAVFVEGDLRAVSPTTGERIRWGYHVAPLLIEGENPWVIDPGFRNEPLGFRDWLGRMGINESNRARPDEKGGIRIIPGSIFESRFRDDPALAKKDVIVSSFAEMPAFRLAEIAGACNVLHRYLASEGRSAQVTAERRKKLIDRTLYLAGHLRRLTPVMLDHGYGTRFECGGAVHAVQPLRTASPR